MRYKSVIIESNEDNEVADKKLDQDKRSSTALGARTGIIPVNHSPFKAFINLP